MKSRKCKKEDYKKKSKCARKGTKSMRKRRSNKRKGGAGGLAQHVGRMSLAPIHAPVDSVPYVNPVSGVTMTQASMPTWEDTNTNDDLPSSTGLPTVNDVIKSIEKSNRVGSRGNKPPNKPPKDIDRLAFFEDDNNHDNDNENDRIKTVDEIIRDLGTDKQRDLDAYSGKLSKKDFNKYMNNYRKAYQLKYGITPSDPSEFADYLLVANQKSPMSYTNYIG
uniref:Uncharacterized protein n=1 Tax=viral metagenome TaxID=1070528 RepID=A0A6C0AS83_9ZZZZ